MESVAAVEGLFGWADEYALQVGITVFLLAVYFVVGRITASILSKGADKSGFKESSSERAIRILRMLVGLVCALLIVVAWGVEFASLLVFAGTALTLLGVALFASWSILSNITAYFVLLLHPTFRRGTFLRILDADNYAEGYIAELNLFNVRLITENREVVVYPNNLVLGRPCLINPRDRLYGVGKLPQVEPKAEAKAETIE